MNCFYAQFKTAGRWSAEGKMRDRGSRQLEKLKKSLLLFLFLLYSTSTSGSLPPNSFILQPNCHFGVKLSKLWIRRHFFVVVSHLHTIIHVNVVYMYFSFSLFSSFIFHHHTSQLHNSTFSLSCSINPFIFLLLFRSIFFLKLPSTFKARFLKVISN